MKGSTEGGLNNQRRTVKEKKVINDDAGGIVWLRVVTPDELKGCEGVREESD